MRRALPLPLWRHPGGQLCRLRPLAAHWPAPRAVWTARRRPMTSAGGPRTLPGRPGTSVPPSQERCSGVFCGEVRACDLRIRHAGQDMRQEGTAGFDQLRHPADTFEGEHIMITVNAYAAPSASEPLVPTTIQHRDLRPHDLLIDIAYAGNCHYDIRPRALDADDGRGPLPVVRGPQDRRFRPRGRLRGYDAQVGDRVGVGYESGSCGECGPMFERREGVLRKGQLADLLRRRSGRRVDCPLLTHLSPPAVRGIEDQGGRMEMTVRP